MKIHDIQQGHIDWFKLRMGKVTASELGNLITPEFELRKGETPKTYVYMKAAEAWRQQPLIFTGSWATEQGNMRQDEAIPFLALEKDWKIDAGGFIESDDGTCGCSPDGIVHYDNWADDNPSGFGIEVKCPEPAQHVRYLVEGGIPKQYVAQVYGSLYVTGWSEWVFMSYYRDFPPLIVGVARDQEKMEKIGVAIEWFHNEFKRVTDRIAEFASTPEQLRRFVQ